MGVHDGVLGGVHDNDSPRGFARRNIKGGATLDLTTLTVTSATGEVQHDTSLSGRTVTGVDLWVNGGGDDTHWAKEAQGDFTLAGNTITWNRRAVSATLYISYT